ncbi:hypothetical protein ACTG16_23285 [Aeromonas sp. 23P]|uniref:hypothetical protein n=1 Tax=Aeromonas sp. 23P TaxID=3452716 RepID=UPI003F7A726C
MTDNPILAKLHAFLNGFFGDTELATDEHYQTIDVSKDPFLPRIMEQSQGFDMMDSYMILKSSRLNKGHGRCHFICAEHLVKNPDLGHQLFTGFALSYSMEWFTHTFLVHNGCIIEPSDELHLYYVGIELTDNDKDVFLCEWGYDTPL